MSHFCGFWNFLFFMWTEQCIHPDTIQAVHTAPQHSAPPGSEGQAPAAPVPAVPKVVNCMPHPTPPPLP